MGKTLKAYLLIFLGLAIIGFIVAIVGLLILLLSPLLPLFEKEISLLKDKEDVWNTRRVLHSKKRHKI